MYHPGDQPLRTGFGFGGRIGLGNGHPGDPLPTVDRSHRMVEKQWNLKILEALDNVGLDHWNRAKAPGPSANPFQGKPARHNQADIPRPQDDNLFPRR